LKHNLLIRLALNPDDEALAAPHLYRVAIKQLLCHAMASSSFEQTNPRRDMKWPSSPTVYVR
jgi:hypothetical protein